MLSTKVAHHKKRCWVEQKKLSLAIAFIAMADIIVENRKKILIQKKAIH
jgi:hypothetical protein